MDTNIDRKEANAILSRITRANNGFNEEKTAVANFERECIEETCVYNEALECYQQNPQIFIDMYKKGQTNLNPPDKSKAGNEIAETYVNNFLSVAKQPCDYYNSNVQKNICSSEGTSKCVNNGWLRQTCHCHDLYAGDNCQTCKSDCTDSEGQGRCENNKCICKKASLVDDNGEILKVLDEPLYKHGKNGFCNEFIDYCGIMGDQCDFLSTTCAVTELGYTCNCDGNMVRDEDNPFSCKEPSDPTVPPTPSPTPASGPKKRKGRGADIPISQYKQANYKYQN